METISFSVVARRVFFPKKQSLGCIGDCFAKERLAMTQFEGF
jgi:hypothetical protein